MKHFIRTDNGKRMCLSLEAWTILCNLMVETEYKINGSGIKFPPTRGDEKVLKLRQMYIDDDYDIEVLT